MAVAIGEGGVDQVQAEVDGAAQRADGFVVRAAEPLLAADPPGAVADLRLQFVLPSLRYSSLRGKLPFHSSHDRAA